MTKQKASRGTESLSRVTPVRYAPPKSHRFDVELVAAEELRARIAQIDHRGVERIDFHCLMYISAGLYTHMVDFETFDCTQGSCLLIQPGQVHRFGDEQEWAGWLLILRSDLLPPGQTEALSTYTHTSGALSRALVESLERMAHDATHATDVRVTNALLRSQFHALIARLQLAHLAATADARVQPRQLERYQDFRGTAEREFRRWHAVAPYARQLGCSVKSLNRAALEVAGITAKKLLVARVVLEAKRLLAHTTLPVAAIGDQLGFDEATNFVKFFRRETGSTPGAFRTQRKAA